MSKVPDERYAEKLELYKRLIATNPKVERKGDTVPYTSLNGNMVRYLSKPGELALRLPEGEREAFLKKYETKLRQAYGVVQKEYVVVPDALLKKNTRVEEILRAKLRVCKLAQAKADKEETCLMILAGLLITRPRRES